MTTVANTLTNSIVKLKMLEYKNDLSKFKNGVSRKFKFSDTSIVTGREIKFFPISLTFETNVSRNSLMISSAFETDGGNGTI